MLEMMKNFWNVEVSDTTDDAMKTFAGNTIKTNSCEGF